MAGDVRDRASEIDALGGATEGPYRPLGTQAKVALEVVRYDAANGLVPVVVQDASTGHVLMQAYANREALKRTYGTGQAWFWSRSRQDYWRKGETSGNALNVVEVRVDCDGDSVLYLVRPNGPACHTGEVSCYHRSMTRHGDAGSAPQGAERMPHEAAPQGDTAPRVSDVHQDVSLGVELADLWEVVESRWRHRSEGSYTTYLFSSGIDKAAKKVGEEAIEVAIAAKNAAQKGAAAHDELVSESADLLYHLLVLWRSCDITPAQVGQALSQRRG